MVATVGSISIDLATNSVKFANGFRSSATTVERESNRMGKAVKRVDVAMAGLGGVVKGAVGALAGFAAITSGVRAFITNTIEAEKVTRQLEAAIISTGGAAGFSVRELQAMASGFQNVTTYGDEAIQQMQAVLLTFTKIKGNVFRDATEAVLNLATRLGTDLGSAAIQVGKALNDPVKGVTSLTRAGVQFSDEQKRMIAAMVRTNDIAGAQAIILKELETQFGGAARAARDSLGGALQGLSNAWGDLFEISGPAAEKVRSAIDSLVEKITTPEFKEAVNVLGETLFRALEAVADAAEEAADEINRIQREVDEFQKSGTTKDFLDILGLRVEEGSVADTIGGIFTSISEAATKSADEIKAEIQSIEDQIFELIARADATEFDLLNADKLAEDAKFLKDQLADIEAAAVSAANAIRADFAEAFRAAEIASMKALEQFNQQRFGPPAERRDAPQGFTRKVDEATGIGVTRLTADDDENIERTATATEKLVDNMPSWLDELGGEFDASIRSVNELLASGVFFDYASIADAVRVGIVSGMAQERQTYSISTTNPIQKQINELNEMLEVAGTAAAKAIREQIRALELELYLSKRGRDLGGIGGQNVAYAGKFAEGGSFVVPGAPSGDKTRVALDANGGEVVTVTPAGESAKPTVVIHQTYQPAQGETERTTRQNMRNMTIEAFREVGRI